MAAWGERFRCSGEGLRAKLIKPQGSPLRDIATHLALTLCSDLGRCDRDWHAYETDAGSLQVTSTTGCVSVRVSVLHRDGRLWLVRDNVREAGCD